MKIGVDLSVLQTAHRMRGIGSVAINFIDNMPSEVKKKFDFVFYIKPYEENEVHKLEDMLDLEDIKYEIRFIKPTKQIQLRIPSIGGKIINKSLRWLIYRKLMLVGNTKLNLKGVDYYLQFDQHQPLPPKYKVKSAIIAYDIIPYILEADYLWSYKTSRLKGCSRKGALRNYLRRRYYKTNTKLVMKKAHRVIAISEQTRKDLVRYIGVKPSKIHVCLLGVSDKPDKLEGRVPIFKQYLLTSWGYIPKEVTVEKASYLLFIGGADPRRRLVELVAAFNNLRAQGYDIKLVLAGDTMFGAFTVPNVELQNYLKYSSYTKDIYFMGFVDSDQREWLYEHALAFVYPSIYEGFGLPIVEAMRYGTPVVTYDNSSLREVGENAVLYSSDYQTIADSVKSLSRDARLRKKYSELGKAQATKFSWQETVRNIIRVVTV